jgi:hypothetical protein
MSNNIGDTILYTIGMISVVVVMIIVVACLLAFPVKWLWNWIMPILFNLKEITAWQALGLTLLCGLLFKSTVSNQSK